jgi:hypothetical protein
MPRINGGKKEQHQSFLAMRSYEILNEFDLMAQMIKDIDIFSKVLITIRHQLSQRRHGAIYLLSSPRAPWAASCW